MKINYLLVTSVMAFMLFACRPLMGNQQADDLELKVSPPVLIDKQVSLYAAGDFFLAGQPAKETLDSLYSVGVKMVINIRTEEEMASHNLEAYDEGEYIRDMGMEYMHIPVGGTAGFTPEAITAINSAITKTRGKVLIHCRTAGRATLTWMAWLVRYDGYTLDQAVDLGKNAQFSFPLEDLLGYEITMQKAEEE
jgi:uncharacterized protein (TIGR01244 family)